MDIIPAIGSRPSLGDVKGTDPAARTKTVPRMGRKGQGAFLECWEPLYLLCSLWWGMLFFGDKKSTFKEDAIEEKTNGGGVPRPPAGGLLREQLSTSPLFC